MSIFDCHKRAGIPKYVEELMGRSKHLLGMKSAGYCLAVGKQAPDADVGKLRAEVERLKKWADKQMPKTKGAAVAAGIVIDYVPEETYRCNQYVEITVNSEVMKQLEPFVKD